VVDGRNGGWSLPATPRHTGIAPRVCHAGCRAGLPAAGSPTARARGAASRATAPVAATRGAGAAHPHRRASGGVGRRHTVDGGDRVCLALTTRGVPPRLPEAAAARDVGSCGHLLCDRERRLGGARIASPNANAAPNRRPWQLGHHGMDNRGTRRGASEGESEGEQRMPPRVRTHVTGELGERASRGSERHASAANTAGRRPPRVACLVHDKLKEQRVVEKRRIRRRIQRTRPVSRTRSHQDTP